MKLCHGSAAGHTVSPRAYTYSAHISVKVSKSHYVPAQLTFPPHYTDTGNPVTCGLVNKIYSPLQSVSLEGLLNKNKRRSVELIVLLLLE